MRKRMLVGNWKMHKTRSETGEFLKAFIQETGEALERVDTGIAASYPLLDIALSTTKDSGTKVLAQNVHESDQGAFTGEVSSAMLNDVGVGGTLIGHSERRQYYGETNESVAAKLSKCHENGLYTILCIGESKEEREAGKTTDVVAEQLNTALAASGLKASLLDVAYEPVWAIGTGLTASPEQAQEVHAKIRELIGDKLGRDVAEAMRLLYGGSAKPANIADLLAQKDIDGGLVGGASLKPADFAQMVQIAAG